VSNLAIKILIVQLGEFNKNLKINVKKLFVMLNSDHVKQSKDQLPANVKPLTNVPTLKTALKVNLELFAAPKD